MAGVLAFWFKKELDHKHQKRWFMLLCLIVNLFYYFETRSPLPVAYFLLFIQCNWCNVKL